MTPYDLTYMNLPNFCFALVLSTRVPAVDGDFSYSNSIRIPFRLAFMPSEELNTEKHHSQNNIARLRSILTGIKKCEVTPVIRFFMFSLLPRTRAPALSYY